MKHEEAIAYMKSSGKPVREVCKEEFSYSTFWFNDNNELECDDYGLSPWDEFGKCNEFQTVEPKNAVEFMAEYLQEQKVCLYFLMPMSYLHS